MAELPHESLDTGGIVVPTPAALEVVSFVFASERIEVIPIQKAVDKGRVSIDGELRDGLSVRLFGLLELFARKPQIRLNWMLAGDAACLPGRSRSGERQVRQDIQTVREFFDDDVLGDPITGAIRRVDTGIYMSVRDLGFR